VLLLYGIIQFLLGLYLLVMFGRFILDWVQAVSRGWRPRGAMVVVAEIVYTITDPPIKFVRRFVKPIRLGAIQLDLAFTIVIFAVLILREGVVPAIFRALV
jgi:YggT family protein